MSETSEQVDKAVSEIAEGASSQAGETQKATENVITIGNMIEEASQEVKDLNEMASGMQNSNQVAIGILQELGSVNEQTRNSIGDIARQTVTTNESASKIREVTGLITEIAEETNLLSLNASIEAARAGDAGRGFAVVASQIQKLADQSSSSAKQIEEIVDRLISDSEQAVATMDQVKAIISKQSEDVERTGNAFGEVSEGIKNSMSVIQSISEKVRTMDEARVNVVDTVQNLTAIAEENAASTQESSASVTSITGIAVNIEQSSGDLKQIAMDLDEDMINLCWNAFSSRFSKHIRKGSLLMITFYSLVRCLKIPRNCVKLLKRQAPSLLIWNRQRTLNICAVNVTSMHRSGQLRLQNCGIDDVLIFQQEISGMQTGMKSDFKRLRTGMVGKEKVQPLSLFLW